MLAMMNFFINFINIIPMIIAGIPTYINNFSSLKPDIAIISIPVAATTIPVLKFSIKISNMTWQNK